MFRNLVRRMAVTAGLLAAVAVPAAAQRPGTVEIGALGRFTKYDSSLTLKNRLGGGGRLGIFVLPNLALEGAGAYTPTRTPSETVKNTNLAARLVYNLPVAEPLALLVGAGYVHTRYNASVDAKDNGATGLLGLRYWIADELSLRAEGLIDYIPSPANAADDNINWGVQLGVSYLFGGRVSDRDGDGVPDRADACSDTPAGVSVDASGCPIDSDRDGVADYLDACAATPQGASVDAKGCVLDTDGDGVQDDLDRCPTTPRGEAVNAAGCPPDADNDGVADARDRCPNTPAGTAVDANGCPPDADSDGVPNAADRCANTPAGATVDATGCPLDSDGDGVANGLDRCPNTAAGARVDATGCTILFEENTARVVLRGVNFETGSARLTDTAQTILNGVAETLVANPDVRVEVGGHTDNTGSRAVNVRLSQARAEAVVTYLVGRGVAVDRLAARGFGPDQPIADNATRDGRAQNRRVELQRVTQQ